MVGGSGVRIARDSNVLDADLFTCVDVEQRDRDAEVRIASAVDYKWLEEIGLSESVEYFFHPTQRAVQARNKKKWFDLTVSEHPAPIADSDRAAELLYEHALSNWDNVFPSDDERIGGMLVRVGMLRQWMPDSDWPEITVADLHSLTRQLCQGRRSIAELRAAPWFESLRGMLPYALLQRLDNDAPTHWTAPSGNRVAIHYEAGKPPRVAVRLQEIFGLNETPKIAGRRVPLLMDLLGPNYRSQQLTSDLESFWKNTYPTIRKELARRYPKHHWPDDPESTTPTRSGLKRDAEP
jgi:ATP-dependent helicase HrpB